MSGKTASGPSTACIINPRAANKKWLRRGKMREDLRRALPGRVHDTLGERELTVGLARDSCLESDVVVAIGGDGTVADVLQGVMSARPQKNVVFGIIPFGSGNAFRKSFGIPKNPTKAIRILTEGEPREADLVRVEDRVAGFVSIGATAAVTAKKLEHEIHGMLGHLLAVRKMFLLPATEKEVELIDGVDDKGRTFQHKTFRSRFFDCVVAKTNYFGYSWRIAPRACTDDGFLDITFFELSPSRYILFFPLIYLGLFQRTQRHFKAKRIVLKGKDLPIQYNGEFLGRRDRVELEVLPKAIKILGPAAKKRTR
jgi:diacylglycerol kinase family enzyme